MALGGTVSACRFGGVNGPKREPDRFLAAVYNLV